MVNCCVPFCQSRQGFRQNCHVSFHDFPTDPDLSQKWLKVISRKDFKINDKSSSSRVCSLHFRDEDYVPHLKIRRLKKGSIPSIFPGYPAYKIPKQVNKKLRLGSKNILRKNSLKRKHENSSTDTEVEIGTSFETNHENTDAGSRIEDAELFLHFVSKVENESKVTEDENSKISELTRKVKLLHSLLWKKNSKIRCLESKIRKMEKGLKYYEEDECHQTIEKLICLGDTGNKTACFLLEQLKNFGKKKPTWSENIVRECVVWHATSPKGYNFARDQKLLMLPSKITLSRYIGPICGEFGVTSLAQQRLEEEVKKLNAYERFGSLIIDEMAIKSQCIYDNKLDRFFGQKTIPEENISSLSTKSLANRLLCFVLSGLSTTYTIPCAYFFTRQLTGKELYNITINVLQVVEKCGFFVVRIVTDNHKTNVAMFRNLAGNQLTHKIQHPLDESRMLFLAFDQNHIIKNIRSLFLENDMTDGTQVISGKYVKQLYLLQKNESVKAVRNLTNKHINPSNFDKMNVGRAVLIFSPPVTAALQFLQEQSTFHPKAVFFKDAKATVTFLQNIYKWFSAHDVSSRHHYIISKNRLHFFSLDDERLQWLESDFLQYLLSIKQACNSHNPQLKFLSKETYDAIKLTTISTVECIKYILLNGYHYVLTRSFNSDPIESLFSALRQMNGGNDAMDVKSTICSLEKILKTGMIISSKFSNVRKADCISSGVIKFQSQEKNEVNLPELPDSILSILDSIEAPLGLY